MALSPEMFRDGTPVFITGNIASHGYLVNDGRIYIIDGSSISGSRCRLRTANSRSRAGDWWVDMNDLSPAWSSRAEEAAFYEKQAKQFDAEAKIFKAKAEILKKYETDEDAVNAMAAEAVAKGKSVAELLKKMGYKKI